MIKNIMVYQKGRNNTKKHKRLLDTMYFLGKTLKLLIFKKLNLSGRFKDYFEMKKYSFRW